MLKRRAGKNTPTFIMYNSLFNNCKMYKSAEYGMCFNVSWVS
jgi:hypothetical protein